MINVKVFTWYSPCCMVKKSLLLFHYWQKMKPLKGMGVRGAGGWKSYLKIAAGTIWCEMRNGHMETFRYVYMHSA